MRLSASARFGGVRLWTTRSGLLLAGGLVACAWAVVAVLWREAHHFELAVLAAEYLVLVPLLVWILHRGALGRSTVPVVSRRVLVSAALIYGIAASGVAVVFKLPSNMGDESAYRFQARILATGHLTAEAPPPANKDVGGIEESYRFHHHVIHDGRWFGKYPLGWPAILAAGVWAGADWIVNPLLALVLLTLSYQVTTRMFGGAESGLAVLILMASPFFLDQSASVLSHMSCSVFVAASVLALLDWRNARLHRVIVLSFSLLGVASLIRPFTAACIAPVLLLAAMAPSDGTKRWRVTPALVGMGTLVPFASLFLLQNRLLTGSASLSPYAVYRGTALPPEITLDLHAVVANLPVLTRWSVQSTLFYGFVGLIPMALFALAQERVRRREVLLLGGLFLSLVTGYALQTESSDSRFGERYYFEAYWALGILGARGWCELLRRPMIRRRSVAVAFVVLLVTQLAHFTHYLTRLSETTARERAFTAAVRSVDSPNSVVFLQQPLSREMNYNEARWRQAPRFYVEDPGPSRREDFVRALNKQDWILIRYDPVEGTVITEARRNLP